MPFINVKVISSIISINSVWERKLALLRTEKKMEGGEG